MWTNISKPNSNNWVSVNPPGKKTYDDIDTTYDSTELYYDGLPPNQWSNVAKPTSNNWVNVNKPT